MNYSPDLPDILAAMGFFLVVTGVALMHVPTAMVLAGVFCLVLAYLSGVIRRN